MLDLNVLNKDIQASLKKSQSAYGKDLVLVVGKTGAGKSTLVNYLLRFPMRREEGLAVPLDDAMLPPAAMGDSVESITTYPAAYAGQDGFVYCDCPGFEDNRGSEARVCVSVTTEAVIKRAKSIKSVITVIEWGTIIGERGRGLREVALTLGNLFNSADSKDANADANFNLAQSILFVITKTRSDEVSPVSFMRKITALIEMETKRLEQETLKLENLVKQSGAILTLGMGGKDAEKSQQEEIKHLMQKLAILKLIQANPDNSILVNVFDQGQTREAIIDRLKVLQAIPIQHINFHQADSVRHYFQELMAGEIVRAVQNMKQIRNLPQDIEFEEAKYNKFSNDLKQYEAQILDLNSGRVFLGANDPIVLSSKATLQANQTDLIIKHATLMELNNKMKAAKKELYILDVTDEVEFWNEAKELKRNDFIRNRILHELLYDHIEALKNAPKNIVNGDALTKFMTILDLAILRPIVFPSQIILSPIFIPLIASIDALIGIDLQFKYQGAPFTTAKEEYENGELHRLQYEPNKGKYVAKYESALGKSAKAKVTLYGEKCNKPENKIRIEQLNAEIATLEQTQEDTHAEIAQLQATNKKLETFIAEFMETDRQNLQQKVHELRQLREDARKNIQVVGQKIAEKTALLATHQKEFAERIPWCEMVIEISQFLNFNNVFYPDIVTQFTSLVNLLKNKPSLTSEVPPGKTLFFKAELNVVKEIAATDAALEKSEPPVEERSIAALRI